MYCNYSNDLSEMKCNYDYCWWGIRRSCVGFYFWRRWGIESGELRGGEGGSY